MVFSRLPTSFVPFLSGICSSTRATAAAMSASAAEEPPPANPTIELDLEKQYFSYGTMIDEARPPKTARPKTGKSAKQRKKEKDGGDQRVYPESRPQTAKSRFA